MMNRISVAFTVAGDPEARQNDLNAFDAIEIGVPFSDPVAESPDVQKANLRALGAGAKNGAVEAALELANGLRTNAAKIVLYSYYNPIFNFGLDRFFSKCADSGVYGVAIADLPYEERDEARVYAAAHGILLLSTIATTETDRAKLVAAGAEGYLRIEPVGDEKERERVLEAVLAVTSMPFAMCKFIPEAL